ncbi:shikimate dehydrogenase [Oscillatoria sp. FACHB-1406]|uniref:shikimate dehydrogenase n=1 Tax=Oscillatoria sp. FACHB-1406 TaxID=2692846 RepID=UPI001684D4E5|nr:shikimate dehydrogenase [Oscillatoria sp. FACHB-1406]MBD2576594.1 shikimate dehydrogenase [Oscillatoria sp. FACHB-1406]
MRSIQGTTKLLGVIGAPVEHSLSPAMHNAALAHLGLDYVYVPFPVRPVDLERAIAGFEAVGVVGFSITIPHKQAILPLLSQVWPAAQLVGAANTVWYNDGGWSGTNTDVEGFIAPLKALQRDWSQVVPVVLGNGGAARAVVVGCAELGCPEVCVVGRDRDRLDKFKQSWRDTPLHGLVSVRSWDELSGLVSATDLLVNTTPVGMFPHVSQSPVEESVLEGLKADAIAYDLIYTPRPTLFLKLAQQRGAMIIDGTEMLVQQGAAALQIWLQQPVPVDVMRQALLEKLAA